MVRAPRTWLALVAALAVVGSSAGPSAPPAEASVTVLGAGSTWDYIATSQWAADVHVLYGITINYSPVGSTTGREFYIEGQVDFGDSDIPFLSGPPSDELGQIRAKHKTFQYLPTVAGATGIMYNLRTPSGKLITNLQLDSKALTGIFTGTVTQWNDPLIVSQNPRLRSQIPNTRIIPVVRADGSGTSAMFSDYLRQLQPAMWRSFCAHHAISPCGEISFWPLDIAGAVGQKGSDGVANYVQQQTGTITYVETGYALARNFPVVLVRNASGHYVFPSSQNDATALTHARIQSDLISDLSGVHTAPERTAYPIAGYSYMITPTREGFGFTRAKGAVLGKFILYAACAGQKQASQLGYSPLTPVLVRGVFAAVRRIPGAPTPPPLSKCANPTLHGGASQGPTGNQGGSNTTGGSGPTSGGGPKQHSKHHQKPAKTRGGTTPATSGATPTVGLELTANQLSSRRASALKALGGVKPGSSTPLALAILDVLAIALCPWIIWHRRRRADSGGVSSNVEGG
ncbi:MAG: phosphate transport system substrate-binding protein [Gaiellales bacterium]|nr:phosphate transport system substrate-binding protein [Gaiellales bacterium]